MRHSVTTSARREFATITPTIIMASGAVSPPSMFSESSAKPGSWMCANTSTSAMADATIEGFTTERNALRRPPPCS